jgi:hypothetical protein
VLEAGNVVGGETVEILFDPDRTTLQLYLSTCLAHTAFSEDAYLCLLDAAGRCGVIRFQGAGAEGWYRS